MGKKKFSLNDSLNRYILTFLIGTTFLATQNTSQVEAVNFTNSHLGTFEGQTIYRLTSETGILPNLELELKNQDGSIDHYETSNGTLDLTKTKHGATIKSAILKGNTLVNLLNKLTVNGEVGQTTNWYTTTYTTGTLKSGTYILLYHVKETSGTTSRNTPGIGLAGGTYLYHGYEDFNTTTGIKKWIFTTDEDSSEFGYWLTYNTGKVVVEDFILLEYQEGMENWDITYFEGMQSVKMPVLTISNEDNSKSTSISFEEEVVLRSNGEVYDELDLLTGKLTQRIGEDGEVLSTPKTRVLKINADSIFESIKEAEVNMVGTIDATIASVTLPTEPLSFRINPNLPANQQFVASEFSITNNSQSPLTLELKEFVQTTDVFEDVEPDYYEEWKNLTKEESKRIALGLVPKDSENWLTLNEGTYYVAETRNAILGRVKSQSTVDFEFSALHGQAFDHLPNPQYRLTFVFGF